MHPGRRVRPGGSYDAVCWQSTKSGFIPLLEGKSEEEEEKHGASRKSAVKQGKGNMYLYQRKTRL